MSYTLREIDLKTADRDYPALNAFMNQMRTERLPDDPPVLPEERVSGWQNIPPIVDVPTWIIEDSQERIIAHAEGQFFRMEQNQHLIQFSINVLPEFRRQGWAKRLLQELLTRSEKENRSLLVTATNSRVAAGEAFMLRLGADKALEGHTNQLDLAELDRNLIQQWMAQAGERASGFELGFWDGSYPEAELEAIAHLQNVMNSAPRGNLKVEDFNFGPEELRQIEKMIVARGERRITTYVREKATGKFAGFSEITYSLKRPSILSQQGTGVFPEYRNLGLGRWLKAAMIDRIVQEVPEARFIRTGNADSNAAMLSINHALGFKPYMADAIWQIETQKVGAYLRANL